MDAVNAGDVDVDVDVDAGCAFWESRDLKLGELGMGSLFLWVTSLGLGYWRDLEGWSVDDLSDWIYPFISCTK